ncbi:MAG: hypothetical protein JKY60_11990 [Kordiimonadaceae bacterium]|nr:hypothetical protein [Kordiimonadaceae bacterium]
MKKLLKLKRVSFCVAGVLMLFSATAASASTDDDGKRETSAEISDAIDLINLKRHKAVAETKLVEAEALLVDKRLKLLKQKLLLANGGIAPKTKPAGLRPTVAPKPVFQWPPLPELRSFGSDIDGPVANLVYSDGTRIKVRVGSILRGKVKVDEVSAAGIKVSLGKKHRWIN